ncbi:HEAT repeat family protein, partial [Cryptosporidium felis]
MGSETDSDQNKSLLGDGESSRRHPNPYIFDQFREEDVLSKSEHEIEILRHSIDYLSDKRYRNSWRRFLKDLGRWLREYNHSAFLEHFGFFFSKKGYLLPGIWLLEGFLSLRNKEVQDKTGIMILNILKSSFNDFPSNGNLLGKKEYMLLITQVSLFLELVLPSYWRIWIVNELQGLNSCSGISYIQKVVLDITLHYIEGIHSDQNLVADLLSGITQSLSVVAASGIDLTCQGTLGSIIRVLQENEQDLAPMVGCLMRQLRRSSLPLYPLLVLEYFVLTRNALLAFRGHQREVITLLSEVISSSIANTILSSSCSEQFPKEVQIIQKSLNICFKLAQNQWDFETWLTETLSAISSNKTSLQIKISSLLVVSTMLESLTRTKMGGASVGLEISEPAQDSMLALVDLKLPMAPNQVSDHFKALAIHVCLTSLTLLEESEYHSFTNKVLSKTQSLIGDPSTTEICKLLAASSFIQSLNITNIPRVQEKDGGSVFEKSALSRTILSNNHFSSLLCSTFGKTSHLRRLSVILLGQIISVLDFSQEENLFKTLNVISIIKTSPLLLPGLGSILTQSYSFLPNSNKNLEICIFLVLVEMISNKNCSSSLNISFQGCPEDDRLDLKACVEILKDPSKIPSINLLIGFLIQLGRILPFISKERDINAVLSQYSLVNLEVFQGGMMLPELKKTIHRDEGLECKQSRKLSLSGLLRQGSLFGNVQACQGLILSFAVILGTVHSSICKNRRNGRLDDGTCEEFKLPKVDLFGIWLELLSTDEISKGDPSILGYSYFALFLLCSCHPLIITFPEDGRGGATRPTNSNNRKIHTRKMKLLVSELNKSGVKKQLLDKKIADFFTHLTYLPLNEISGFRRAGLSMLKTCYFSENQDLSLELVGRLKSRFQKSLDFLNTLPTAFCDFMVSKPDEPFEFSLIIESQTPEDGFVEDLQSGIAAKVRAFTSSDPEFMEFSEVYDTLTDSLWLEETITNLDYTKSAHLCKESEGSLASKRKEPEAEPEKKASTTPAKATSAFALAKLRKSQNDSKTKGAKPPKSAIVHAKSHANLNTGANLSTCRSNMPANADLAGATCGSNSLTKDELLRQKLREQGKMRKEAERIIFRLRSELDVMTGLRGRTLGKGDAVISELLYLVCGRMLGLKPLRICGLRVLEDQLGGLIENRKLVKAMVGFLSDMEEGNMGVRLREVLDSVDQRSADLPHIGLRSSPGTSVLVFIISRVLFKSCMDSGAESDKLTQTASQLMEYVAASIRQREAVRVPVAQVVNMLCLYVLALGDLLELDCYFAPLREVLHELRPSDCEELDLISSLLVFANPGVRFLVLDSINRAVGDFGLEINYYTFLCLSISRESGESGEGLLDRGVFSAEELSGILEASEKVISRYEESQRLEEGVAGDRDERLVRDLLAIQVSPVLSTAQQRSFSRAVSRISRSCGSSGVIDRVMESSTEVLNRFERRKVFAPEDWPEVLTRGLDKRMVPEAIKHLDSVIPKFTDKELLKTVARIQARHSLKGLVLVLSDLLSVLGEEELSLVELSLRFVLTRIVDSEVFLDYRAEEREALSREAAEAQGSGGKRRGAVTNSAAGFGARQDSPEKVRIKRYDVASRDELKEVIVGLFASLSSNQNLGRSFTQILAVLRDFSAQYQPKVNQKDFHNCLASAIGNVASCCSPSDPIVYKVTCKIVNELLGGSLVRGDFQTEAQSSSGSKTQSLPTLMDIPQEYSRILPRLLEMLYGGREGGLGSPGAEEAIRSLEQLDADCLAFRMDDSGDPGQHGASGFELYRVSLGRALYSEDARMRIGAAHMFGSLCKGLSVRRLRDFGVLEAMESALGSQEALRGSGARGLEGLLLCIGALSLYLEHVIEPYTIRFLRSLIALFSESEQRIRFYSEKTAEIVIKNLSRFGVKLILPIITQGVEEKQWRVKLTSLQLLGIMAVSSPHQLSSYLPKAIQTIYQAVSDSHPKVSAAARETLHKMASLIKNPEVSCISQELVAALVEPTESSFKAALLSLKSVTFVHAVDITTLSLIFPVLLKTIQERGVTDLKKDAIQVLTSLLLLLSDRSDVDPFLPLIENSVHSSLSDPIPEVRLLTAKLCRALVRVTGQEKASSLLDWLFRTLSMEVGQTLKSGVSAALAEVLSTLGIDRFREILPHILSRAQGAAEDGGDEARDSLAAGAPSSPASVREGYVGLFVYLPQSFGDELGALMPEVLPRLLPRLGDESEAVRDVALRACRALVLQFGSDQAAYILQPLEEGLANESWRVRLGSCSLLGTLLNRLVRGQLDSTGIALSTSASALDQAGFSMQRRSYILAAIYMARSDENSSVRSSATVLWKSLVQNTPQTLKDILPILVRRIINALSASSSDNAHHAAVQSLKDLLEKFGSALQKKLLPIFYQNLGGLLDEDGQICQGALRGDGEVALPGSSVRVGSCIGVLEVLKAVRRSELASLTGSFLPIIRLGLSDADLAVRTYSVLCLDVLASEAPEALLSVVDWLLGEVLSSGAEQESLLREDPRISALELILRLQHPGIVSSILPRVVSGPASLCKLRIIGSMSKVPSQARLRSALFELVPVLVETCADLPGEHSESVRESSRDAMAAIAQALDEQGTETFVTILLDVVRENTPSANLSVSGVYQIESLGVACLEELVDRGQTLRRSSAIEFLSMSLHAGSPVFDSSLSLLVKYLVPLALCDVSEQVRVQASKALQLFSASLPRRLAVRACAAVREAVGSLVHDPTDNRRHFERVKLIGSGWEVRERRVVQPERDCLSEELRGCGNRLADSLSALYLQGLSQGSPESREECALGLGEAVMLTHRESLRPIAVKLAGPLIRSVSDRTTTSPVRAALLGDLVLFLECCGAQLRPLLPQIQTILLRFLLDPDGDVRRQCSSGIGLLTGLLGGRAEALLGDLCSLASRQSQSAEALSALLASISLSLRAAASPGSEARSRPEVSECLRNKLIGMSLAVLEEAGDAPALKDAAGQILSSILVHYCSEDEVREILTPLFRAAAAAAAEEEAGDPREREAAANGEANLLGILNSACEADGWARLCSCLRDERAGEGAEEEALLGAGLPWIYRRVSSLLVAAVAPRAPGRGGDLQLRLRRSSVGLLLSLARSAARNADALSACIVLRVLSEIFAEGLLELFPAFSDSQLILEVQKVCEVLVDAGASRGLFSRRELLALSVPGLAGLRRPERDLLLAFASVPSFQSLRSKFPAVRLKAEQTLIHIARLAVRTGCCSEERDGGGPTGLEPVVSRLVGLACEMYPGLLSREQTGFVLEYSRRVLSRAE